jgi:hypothetical protein
VIASACEKSTPTAPSSTTTATAAAGATEQAQTITIGETGITMTSPVAIAPPDGQKFGFGDQPLKLIVNSAVTTGKTALTYIVEVATDGAFTHQVFAQGGIAATAGDQQTITIGKLAGQQTYFWRVRAGSGKSETPNTRTRSFSIGPEVTLQTPNLISPSQNGTASGNAVLTVANVGRSGPASHVTYKFDLSDSSSFGNIVFSKKVDEQPGQTSVTVDAQLRDKGVYYWRAQAFDDGSHAQSPMSGVNSFTYSSFDLHQATIYNSPFDLADWAETAHITSIVFTNNAFLVDFDRRDGPGRWPDTPFGDGSIEYTLGLCLNIGNHWDCSAAVQFWFGRELSASGGPWAIATEWFYDPARWGPMAGHQPQDGETVGIFACAGNCRNNTAGDASYVKERTNVALVPWDNEGQTSYTFSNGRVIMRRR